ncbi:lytic transglycosylase domain-containing protein [Vibrio parahaemolyticus]|uniref:lytic transglycosylase domain-containing protein n=1 Tax=Vibrio parahaemolyticus TaxID=670 RepID=UPI0028099E34|nr:lytic transglycosylase domain-containing protein [Vibrio parahaemolyticus]EJE4644427.1 lytic transglycosylase domain-containing protein [Vibrio parahaemolyticus]ELA9292974.1 lytic transglycosylase domain-containing protein [Vibrio parahaemolyticus]MDS1925670.1 lytic transglycosylase domain-containing protein [Vibrio parahaemolyticus]HCG8016777.1 lytic transglycosylase domain-containing protein [Vibrio parahaemolyticus]
MAVLEFAALAAMCAPNIHETTLSAVVSHESRANIYAINVNGDYVLPKQPDNLKDAVETVNRLLDEGYNLDAGLGQINSANYEWLGLDVPDLFDPCKNLTAAATVLTDCYSRALNKFSEGQEALQAALSCYNTGSFSRGFKNGYVAKVASNVGVSIPALEPIAEGDGRQPVQLQANRSAKRVPRQAGNDEPGREKSADVFGASSSDAFATSDHLKKLQQDAL